MNKILVIPDIHLKPKIFDQAEKILASGQADLAIQMGDMVDDWGEEFNLPLYERTLKRAIKFQKDHPDTLWVMGNHDYGYWHPNMGVRETGHSRLVETEVLSLLEELRRAGGVQKIMHVVNGCIFTHAGLTMDWVADHTPANSSWDNEIDFVHNLTNDATTNYLWEENSPIWARPQIEECIMYPAKLQITGHTPVKKLGVYGGCLSTDTFSTYRNGAPYGDQKFAIVNTVEGTWAVAEEEND